VNGGVRLAVRLTPRASRDEIDGIVTGANGRPALQVRLKAPPIDGAANNALIAFLAETLEIRKGDISIRAGHTSRLKIVHLSGDSAELLAKLQS
jgi:hypothetical protein